MEALAVENKTEHGNRTSPIPALKNSTNIEHRRSLLRCWTFSVRCSTYNPGVGPSAASPAAFDSPTIPSKNLQLSISVIFLIRCQSLFIKSAVFPGSAQRSGDGSNPRETSSSIRGTVEPSVGYSSSLIPLRFSLRAGIQFFSSWKDLRFWLRFCCTRTSVVNSISAAHSTDFVAAPLLYCIKPSLEGVLGVANLIWAQTCQILPRNNAKAKVR